MQLRNIKKQCSFFQPVSIRPLLGSSPNHTVTSATVRPNGSPIINCSTGVVYSYDASLLTWVKVTERWWLEGSDVWQGRQRTANNQVSSRGVMAIIESSIGGGAPEDSGAEKRRPEWWNIAMTLGHLETKLHAIKLLDSPQEYKQVLLVYAKRIADEGFRAKAEELIKDFFGPIYW